jgi:hypothetical protein
MESLSATFNTAACSSYTWVLAALVAITYYVSLPQGPAYRLFPRAGGTVLRWTPVHDVVADAYEKVH